MSDRHQKRSRCTACREETWNQPTHLLVHRKLNRYGLWEPLDTVLCAACLDIFLSLCTPPEQPLEDWIGLVDGRMWPRRHASAVSLTEFRRLEDIDPTGAEALWHLEGGDAAS